ncbi:transcriptional regulator [Geobacillus subterraneus]|uniref:Transcriptional regulator n=2 Tax=Geobacillus TaxID=129337 RepID=A0ABN4NEI9_9BACL|nr:MULTISPECIES: helix-turn-helix domain-containing protein [Geobacillus]AMX82904.1 transcriptional regulator [Geobacillus subterraneus]KZS24884.1 transcriptional regulator [Geobacillus subterraneus]OXB90999.1 transcriptional regulator [Geobacillus uzenensis]
MEQTLKITNVLSDPTRFHIYEYMAKIHREVSVQEIAEKFHIHPNVARLHLTKLEDVRMVVSDTQKTGKGGRPSRLYRLSDEVVGLYFPFRDYKLLAQIAIQTMAKLGPAGLEALRETGKQFGYELVASRLPHNGSTGALTLEEKIRIMEEAAEAAGFLPQFHYEEDEGMLYLDIFNCPFKEIAVQQPDTVCGMHHAFLEGMVEALFADANMAETENMMDGSRRCAYRIAIRP